MNFSRIKKIKLYVQQIKKFRALESNKNSSNEEFFILMKNIFPKFQKEFPQLFKNVIYNRDMNILDVMFKKLDDIEFDYNLRKEEIKIIEPFINDAKEVLIDNNGKKKKLSKNTLHNLFRKNNSRYSIDYKQFIDKYPKVIDRLLDEDFLSFNSGVLLYEQVKFSHEVYVGKVLAQKYIDPVVAKNNK